jgi:ABC-type transporter Mla subunit MlaD
VLAAALVVWSAIELRVPLLPRGGHVIEARLPSAANARAGQPVRVSGVDVGRIEKLTAAPGGGVVARLRIDGDVAVHADATADLRARTMFGRNMYVDLDPGSRSAPALRGEIGPTATGSQVDFDQVLAPFGAPGRAAVRSLLAETADALLEPRPPREALRLLRPTMRGIDQGLRPLRGTADGDLPRLLGNTAKLARALGASEADLAGLVEDGATTLGATAARRADLGRLLQIAPGALANSRRTLARLDTTLDRLDPLVHDLDPGARLVRPAVDAAKPTLAALRRTLDDLAPTARALRGALSELRRAVPSARSVIDGLRPVLQRLNERVLPGLAERDEQTGLRLYEAMGPAFAAASSSVGEYDARGHMIRFQVNAGESSFNPSACQVTGLANRPLCGVMAALVRRMTAGAR